MTDEPILNPAASTRPKVIRQEVVSPKSSASTCY